MATKRGVAAGLLLFLEGGLAAYGVVLHYDMTAIYGSTHASVVENWAAGFGPGGISGIPVVFVLALVTPAFVAVRGRAARVFVLAAPVAMVLAMLAVTPLAIEEKRQSRNDGPRAATGACTVSAMCDGDLVGGAAL